MTAIVVAMVFAVLVAFVVISVFSQGRRTTGRRTVPVTRRSDEETHLGDLLDP